MDRVQLDALRAAWLRASDAALAGYPGRGDLGARRTARARFHEARDAYAEALAIARCAPADFRAWVQTHCSDDDDPRLRRRKRDMMWGIWWDWSTRTHPGFTPSVHVRAEAADDPVEALVEAAFGRPDEARLVGDLRPRPGVISLVAVLDGAVVGHIMLSPVTIEGQPTQAAAIAPLSVAAAARGRGVGSALAHAGLDRYFDASRNLCFVLGDPGWYAGLGFVPAAPRWRCDWPGTEEAFQVTFGNWVGVDHHPGGRVLYDPAFDRFATDVAPARG